MREREAQNKQKVNTKTHGMWLTGLLCLSSFLGLLNVAGNQVPAAAASALFAQDTPVDCTIYVATDGDDTAAGSILTPFRTIQKAAELAQAGDVICVREGIYQEFNIEFINSGTSTQPITLKNYPGESPVMDGGDLLDDWQEYGDGVFYTEDFDQSHYVSMVTEDDRMLQYDHSATIETLITGGMLKVDNRIYVRPYAGTVHGHTFTLIYQPSAIRFLSRSYIHVEGFTFKNFNQNTVYGDAESHYITIQNSVFKNNVRTALRFDGDHITIDACDISWSGVIGILFTGGYSVARNCSATYITNAYYATSDAHDILFENCEASHFARRGIPNTGFRGDGDGVGLGPSTNVVVRNCDFYDSGNDFPISEPEEQEGHVFDIWKADQFTIENNIIHDVQTAFTVAPGRNGLIQNNLIYNVEVNGISFWGSTENPGYNNKVYNNTIYNCLNNGIHISPYTTNVELQNNIVMNCGNYEYSITEADGNVEDYNLFYDEDSDYVVSWLGSAKTVAQYQQASGQGTHSLGVDPLLQDVSTENFRLQDYSPAVDSGLALPDLTYDIEGTTRPQGAGYDIGAYESLSGTEVPTFEDVPLDHWAYTYIEILYQQGYIAGCSTSPRLYCPEQIMTRAESAVFIERGIHNAEYMPPDPSQQIFDDVALTEWFAKWTSQLWEDGYTSGCGTDPLIYCPLQEHTIAEGCVFYLRMMKGADYEPQEATGIFTDVPLEAWYARWVEDAYAEGILLPCQTEPDLMACPLDGLERAMGAYMMVQAKEIELP
jgi:hypothetical protein